ncbi:MAG: sulfatase [Proteobacteria bacterium]|nr:sulfatase [Pseudomonadota bacterium]
MPDPQRAVVVLLDSLNRHMLAAYGQGEFDTPNLDRLAARATRFDRHYAGSLPCMPARHDILCGALDFLWKPWGSIEIWEEPITRLLRSADVTTMLVADHPHLFETGGENYHTDFSAWEYLRGHEGDPWRTRPDPSWLGAPLFGRAHMPYDNSRGYFRDESDFPGPRTMQAATDWLRRDAPHHERFLLFVDEFDPHEPFDTPEPWASRYDPDWEGPHLIWPPYATQAVASGVLSEREARQVRASYGAKLSMIDHWLGRVLDAMDAEGLWDDTVFILCTDHGHYLGEKDLFGKPRSPVFEPLGHTPLLVAWPGAGAGICDALTTSVDLFATLADLFQVEPRHRTHGRSLLPLLRGETERVRDHVLTGIWGREIHWTDGRTKYACAPAAENEPLSMWSNRWSTMPIHALPKLRLPPPDDRAFLDRMPGSKVPVLRQPFQAGDMLPFWGYGPFSGNHLFDLANDPDEDENQAGTPLEDRAREALRAALLEVEAPADQLERLDLT